MARLLMAIVVVFLCCHSTKIIVNFYEAVQVRTMIVGECLLTAFGVLDLMWLQMIVSTLRSRWSWIIGQVGNFANL